MSINYGFKLSKIWVVCLLFTNLLINPQQKLVAETNKDHQSSNSQSSTTCDRSLDLAINNLLNRPELSRLYWGILIKNLATGETIYQLNADKFLIPASNTKLLTTAAALLQLGENYQFETKFYATGKPPHLDSLRLFGGGDPSLTTAQLQAVIQQLKAQGVTSINNLIIDDSYFQDSEVDSTWEWEDIYADYGVAVSGIILNQNAVTLTILPQQQNQPVKLVWSDNVAAEQWRVDNQAITAPKGTPSQIRIEGNLGSPLLTIKGQLATDAEPDIWGLAIPDPVNYLTKTWQNLLLDEKIKFNQISSNYNTELIKNEYQIANIQSAKLSQLINTTNQESNNLYAEVLEHQLTKELETVTEVSPTAPILTQLGVDATSYSLRDGSGLSRHNLISPQAIVQTLELMSKTKLGAIYRQSLPLAGVSGTLSKRFLNTPVQGYLRAKTGTLTGVSALSGYLEIPGQSPLIFSIMVNQSNQSVATLRETIDQIVLLLPESEACQK